MQYIFKHLILVIKLVELVSSSGKLGVTCVQVFYKVTMNKELFKWLVFWCKVTETIYGGG
jgi:hypothetical protein